jgi:hypothetical protein
MNARFSSWKSSFSEIFYLFWNVLWTILEIYQMPFYETWSKIAQTMNTFLDTF